MFYGTDYEFDTINNKFIINVPDEEKLKRSFYLKDLHGRLYAQIDEVLLQEVDNNIIEEYDNYYQEELDRWMSYNAYRRRYGFWGYFRRRALW